jgi:hypothetical protein
VLSDIAEDAMEDEEGEAGTHHIRVQRAEGRE